MGIKQPLVEVVGSIADTAAHYSGPVDLEDATHFSATLSWAGGTSPAGTFWLQCDDAQDPADAVWNDLQPILVIGGNSGSLNIHDADAAYRMARGAVQLSSGDAVFTLRFTRKG